ncbi:hypothetical protein [Xylanibacillus composti]|uniref:Helicase XPB/Ssl2 N-terminal domain-containing protein n=1 Tax=Xylanibacillus composti TaxID=1572762 RepID=A0A8J4M1B4_9BACL|nr:hypothetical protein [Xylanibacillus composti]GIQ68700.1 hypothetical protein XYCOK13_15240 [Xylanibacillus composti]
MRMSAWLEQVPPSILEQIAAHPFHREELQTGTSLLECLTDGKVLRRGYDRMTSLEREALQAICREFGLNRFQWDDLQLLPAHRPIAEWKAAVAALCEKGLLCAWQKAWGEWSFSLPAEACQEWSELVVGTPFEQAAEWKLDELEQATDEQGNLVIDILLLGWFLQNAGLTRGKQGHLHKAACRKLEQLLSVPSSYCSPDESESQSTSESDSGLSAGAAAVIDAAARFGLLQWEADSLSLQPEAWRTFLAQTGVRQFQQLAREWLLWHAPPQAWLQHAGFAILNMPETGWYDLQHLFESMREKGVLQDDLAWPSFAASLQQSILQPMEAFGWLQTARMRDGRVLLQKSADVREQAGEEMNKPCLSSQGEVMLPLGCELEAHWDMLCCSEFAGYRTPIALYQITQSSVLRGKEQGKSMIDVVGGLGVDIPANLLHQLEEWEGRYGEVEVSACTVIRCRNGSLADQLRQWSRLRGKVEAAGEGILLVRGDLSQKELIKLISGNGFHVTLQKREEPGGKLAAEPLRQWAAGFEDLQGTAPAKKLPDIPDLYERMSAIPASWLHEFRTYHPSTGRQMIEHAIRYRSGVQLRIQGDAIRFHPERVLGDTSGWKVEGWVAAAPQEREMKQFSPKDWEEIQLILPGINDNNEVLRS